MRMLQSKSTKFHDFTEVLDALEAIDSFPFDKNLTGESEITAKKEAQISPERAGSSKNWLLHILSSITGRKVLHTPQDGPAAYEQEAVSVEDSEEDFSEQFSQLERENIAYELGLRGDLSKLDLRKIRRDFAKENHPDRCEEAFREEATRRMTIANMLIDEARKKQKSGLPWT